MTQTIIINWKWLSVNAIDASTSLPAQISSDWVGERQVSDMPTARLIQLNLQREEAEFDDEDELYDPANTFLKNWLEELSANSDTLLLLHKNAPHYYCAYDADYFQSHFPHLKIVLFGGGEDFVYDLHNPDSGILDQVGGFAKSAVTESKEIDKAHFMGIWEHYCASKTSFNPVFEVASQLLDELMPNGVVSENSKAIAQKLIEADPDWLTAELKTKLLELQNTARVDLKEIRVHFEKVILETTI